MRKFHNLIMNYRNKRIGHSDNFLKAGIVGGARIEDKYLISWGTLSRITIENKAFYRQFEKLIVRALSTVQHKLEKASHRLIQFLDSNEAQITDELCSITPIPANVNPLEMWEI